MADESPRQQIETLEAQIERLAEAIERCGKFILAAKIAIVVGALLLVALVVGFLRGPEILIAATAALIGGIVALGTNVSTLSQLDETYAAAVRLRAQAISRIDLRLVSGGGSNHAS